MRKFTEYRLQLKVNNAQTMSRAQGKSILGLLLPQDLVFPLARILDGLGLLSKSIANGEAIGEVGVAGFMARGETGGVGGFRGLVKDESRSE